MRSLPTASARLARALAACILAAGSAVLIPGATSAAATCLSSPPLTQQLSQVTARGHTQPLAGSIPVLFVHGINEGPGIWDASSPHSIPAQAAAISGMTAWTFNYFPESLQWVNIQQIGPNLATAISCLVHVTGKSVIIVAHSMGGLAAQFALSRLPIVHTSYGPTSSPDVLEVITIGTPYQGSRLLSYVQAGITGSEVMSGEPVAAVAEAFLSYCAGRGPTGGCGLAAIPRSRVGTALEYESSDIQHLPSWPDHLLVWDIAGDMTLSLFDGILKDNVGDFVVTFPSATAHDVPFYPADLVTGPDSVPCHADIANFWKASCFHLNLPTNKQVVSDVISELHSVASISVPTAGVTGPCRYLPTALAADAAGQQVTAQAQAYQPGDHCVPER